MTTGERIKARRLELGLTLLEVAERLGVAEATAQRYESGNIKNIKYTTIVDLAYALNTTPAALLGWNEKEPADSEWSSELEKSAFENFRALLPEQKAAALTYLRYLLSEQDKH